jgi:Immunoglobulin I-set domain
MNLFLKYPIASVVVILAMLVAAYFGAHSIFEQKPEIAMSYLKVAIGWGGAILIGALGLAVVYRMFNGTIDLTQLVSEPSGDASMSRFQFLVFTFVIAISFILITVSDGKFPDLPANVLALLGISAGSYVVSKGIQKDITLAQMQASISLSPDKVTASPGQSVTFSASATGPGDLTYQWQRLNPGQTTPTDLPRETNNSLTLTATVQDDGAQFQCKVSSSGGEATSSPATLRVRADRG